MTVEPPFVFICHPHEAADVAEELSKFLGVRNVIAWFDKNIGPGRTWSKELSQHLGKCAALVVLVAPGVDDLTWLRREIGTAKALTKPIYPLMLPGADRDALSALQINHLQGYPLVDGYPSSEWVREVHDLLYSVPATLAPPPIRMRPDRRGLVIAAAAAAVTGLALGWLGGWLSHSPTKAPSADAAVPGPCVGKAAHIDAVSTVSPGHTGYTPQITVTVCTPAANGHIYWLMDYTVGGGGRRFYAKAMVDGSTGSRPYRVVHDRGSGVASSRTYLVLDVPSEMQDEVAQQWTTPDGAPLVAPGTDLPANVMLISNESAAVL